MSNTSRTEKSTLPMPFAQVAVQTEAHPHIHHRSFWGGVDNARTRAQTVPVYAAQMVRAA